MCLEVEQWPHPALAGVLQAEFVCQAFTVEHMKPPTLEGLELGYVYTTAEDAVHRICRSDSSNFHLWSVFNWSKTSRKNSKSLEMDAGEQSELVQLAVRTIQSYNKWDLDAILESRTPDCKQAVLPARLNQPSRSNAEYREYFSNFLPYFQNFHLEILDITEDPKRHKVSMHVRGTANTALGDYLNEYIVITQMTDDDKQVKHILEFVDSGYSVDFFTRMRAHIAAANS